MDMADPLLETAEGVAERLGVTFSDALHDKIVNKQYDLLTDDLSFQYDQQEDGRLSP